MRAPQYNIKGSYKDSRHLACERKKSYTRKKANIVAKWIKRKLGDALQPYKCEICGKWHLTHGMVERYMTIGDEMDSAETLC